MSEVADAIAKCVPVMDLLSAGTMFGVLAVNQVDLEEICR